MHRQNSSTMLDLQKPLDYLIIGHITKDITDEGNRLGGTAAFSGLTARALGLKTGIITSFSEDFQKNSIKSLLVKNKNALNTTTFKNISDGISRQQYLFQIAEPISIEDIPSIIYPPKILHLGPVANEVDPNIIEVFPESLVCLTPQGWFRKRNQDNTVELTQWKDWERYLKLSDAAVISIEDVKKDENLISKMASSIPVFAVTENYLGARVYWHNDARFFSAPEVKYADDTGAGDIFAAAFFYRYLMTKDPWEAGRFAVLLASWSVTRFHLESIPTAEEITKAKHELMSS